jgi:hypothetical protein
MTVLEQRLMQSLQQLPPGRMAELVDFAEFLAARERRASTAQPEAGSEVGALDPPPVPRAQLRREAVQRLRAAQAGASEALTDQIEQEIVEIVREVRRQRHAG